MIFLPWHLAAAYCLDLLLGDPQRLPHPVRWIGRLINSLERIFYESNAFPVLQRLAGCAFWASVVLAVISAAIALAGVSFHIHPYLGDVVVIWLGYATLSTRSLHVESRKVVRALREGNIELARKRLSWLVSRETDHLDEKGILRALLETVSENLSDGIVAPLFYLSLGGPVAAMGYKAINTMDSMVGYMNDRYRYFGWFAARVDDSINWIPARLSGLILIGAAACLKLDWHRAWKVMLRDARKMKSPNAGYPESAAAGALGVQLGGVSIYFGQCVEKPTLGDPEKALTLETYHAMIRLMYGASFLCFLFALCIRYVILSI